MDFDVVAFFGKKRERARLMHKGDVIPAELEAGFDQLGQLDPEWVWVLVDGDIIKGVLVASPAHGAAMIWRISLDRTCSKVALAKLLRAFLRDLRIRGVRGLLTIMSPSSPTQSQLASILRRVGGGPFLEGMSVYASPMPKEGI